MYMFCYGPLLNAFVLLLEPFQGHKPYGNVIISSAVMVFEKPILLIKQHETLTSRSKLQKLCRRSAP